MSDEKPSEEKIKALQAQIKADQEKPVRENERRVRIGANFKEAIIKMSKTPPISNKDLGKWVKKQREDEK